MSEVRNEGLAAKRRQSVGRAGTPVKQSLVQGPGAQTEGEAQDSPQCDRVRTRPEATSKR